MGGEKNSVKLMLRVQLKLSKNKRIWHHYLCLLCLCIPAIVIPCKKDSDLNEIQSSGEKNKPL